MYLILLNCVIAPPYFNDLIGNDFLSVKIPSSIRPAPKVSQLQTGCAFGIFAHVPSSEHWQPVSEEFLAPLQYLFTTPFRSSHELKPLDGHSNCSRDQTVWFKRPLINLKNPSCQWIYCANMLYRLVAGCWQIRHRLKPVHVTKNMLKAMISPQFADLMLNIRNYEWNSLVPNIFDLQSAEKWNHFQSNVQVSIQ